jgi:choline dehydrogenase-like flavoprotein
MALSTDFVVVDASVMPVATSANTNAPAMKVGHRAGHFIQESA